MKTLLLMITCALFLPLGNLLGQTCADVNGSGSVNISDIVYMINEHIGGDPILAGRGDMDNRQGYNCGDIRFLVEYIFAGGNAPTCPPYPTYTLLGTNDTIYLPSKTIPAGSGSFHMPILMANYEQVADFVLPLKINGMEFNVELDSLQRTATLRNGISSPNWSLGPNTCLAYSALFNPALAPGLNLLAVAYFHYTASPGGTVSFDTTTLGPHTFLNYSHGSSINQTMPIGIPKVAIVSDLTFPLMSVDHDTLAFQILIGDPNPSPLSFSVLSDGAPFTWTLTKPTWVTVSATSGVSDQSIDVNPEVAGLVVGNHYGNIVITSTAIGSPKTVVVKLVVKQQFQSLDANCDGTYNISDVVTQIQYIFGTGVTPCNPCTGELLKK